MKSSEAQSSIHLMTNEEAVPVMRKQGSTWKKGFESQDTPVYG